jgi:hypothetical protein
LKPVTKRQLKAKILDNTEDNIVPCVDGMAHHWDIEEPAGKRALGKCRNCSTVRNFFNAAQPMVNPWYHRGSSKG